jgi:putative transposase
MTTAHDIDWPTVLADRLTTTHPDVLRELLSTFLHTLMGAEADALCGAGYGERSTARTNQRNGYRHREFDTRTVTLDLAIPKLRQGSYFPEWLLERRKRAERALTTVVATCYLLGVSTRRMDKLVGTLGITGLSKSQVSVMAKELDIAVGAFRSRPLDAGPYTFVAADALVLKVREQGRVVNVHTLIATGVNAEGYREILGIDVTTAEDGAGWLALGRSLTARGLAGVRLVTSDAHAGLVAAIGATLPGAAWRRCRTHYATNLMSVTPKASWPWVRTLLHSVKRTWLVGSAPSTNENCRPNELPDCGGKVASISFAVAAATIARVERQPALRSAALDRASGIRSPIPRWSLSNSQVSTSSYY